MDARSVPALKSPPISPVSSSACKRGFPRCVDLNSHRARAPMPHAVAWDKIKTGGISAAQPSGGRRKEITVEEFAASVVTSFADAFPRLVGAPASVAGPFVADRV